MTLLYRLAAQAGAGARGAGAAAGRDGRGVRRAGGGGARGRRRDPHRRPGAAACWCASDRGLRRACCDSGEDIARRARDLERRSQDHVPAAARRASTSTPASCAGSATCAPAAWRRSCTWRSTRLPAFTGLAAAGARRRACWSRRRSTTSSAPTTTASTASISQAPALEITVPTRARSGAGAAGQARALGHRAVRAVRAARRLGSAARRASPSASSTRSSAYAPGLRALVRAQRTADAAGHRARVPHHRRPLAPRRPGARPVLHGAAGARARRSTARRCRACTCAAPAATRAAA